MRVAILNKDKCQPKTCNYLCYRMCPKVKTGDETIIVNTETKKPEISEELCTGCGICVTKCPFEAIHIINLPDELEEPVHQYGKNGFRLYNLPTPKKGVVGIIGSNGIGKTTMLKILSGELAPNMGDISANVSWAEIIEKFRGREIQGYLEKLSKGEIKVSYKPQYVESIPKIVKGKVIDILKSGNELETEKFNELLHNLNLRNLIDKNISDLSGGELQRVAIAACLRKNADMYLLDEPSSYLDIHERLSVAKTVREITGKFIFVVEHDLVVLDYLSDYVHVIYGKSGAYGIISNIKSTKVGINEYLNGFLRSENMRFRGPIKFEVHAPKEKEERKPLASYPNLAKNFNDSFSLTTSAGKLYKAEILGILGGNATGKTTFVKILAGAEKPDNTEIDLNLKVSYKPQYIKLSDEYVISLKIRENFKKELNISHLMNKQIRQLSGGELQRVAIADCLSRDADVYLLDEPSAYLDVEERLKLGKIVRGFANENDVSIIVVEHDVLLVDYLSDSIMVFSGEPGRTGNASEPMNLRDGMNKFLREMDVTFRRDPETGRPRSNKPESVKDREQKSGGEYYYSG